MDKGQIDDLLKSELIGRIGCFDGNKVYVVPVTYAYDNGYIYGHTKDGLKIRIMRKNPNVCFEVDWMKDMSNWKSVIVYGTFEELKGDDANNGLDILMKSIMSNLDREPLSTKDPDHDDLGIENFAFLHSFLSPFLHSKNNEIFEIVVYRIKINEATGKFGDNKKSNSYY
ncbi:pyridoxamine 5'-phosphate oxidase family protein [Candidatus Nitrosocosmicus hydrocola]|uniref:pyridoxamine 5'-phosphate oxidase family protein n=1 Tax=Candidatus Nitrosocosmicus hydrocola TaxID=1826872 RepID=UPI0018C8B9DE|nr:pyridoxamine 5'-phosphate oxidase family protein [Candidatus Nitrosocosmicus hydrocola]